VAARQFLDCRAQDPLGNPPQLDEGCPSLAQYGVQDGPEEENFIERLELALRYGISDKNESAALRDLMESRTDLQLKAAS
jgi:hypothetical protein